MSIESSLQWDQCILCGQPEMKDLGLPLHAGVTSDCKPWHMVVTPWICPNCGHVQKRRSPDWIAQAEDIYKQYSITQDQKLITSDGSIPRKQNVLNVFLKNQTVPETGNLLDVGCGNGNFFPFFHELLPKWNLYGTEYNEGFRESVLSMPGVKGFHDGPLDAIPEDYPQFDLITLFFVIEHLTDPVGVMRQVRALLKPGGLVLVHTDDLRRNPFDLNVVDHSSHFVLDTLAYCMRSAGLAPVIATDQWGPKQITVVGQFEETAPHLDITHDVAHAEARLKGHFNWLYMVEDQVKALAAKGNFGIFGTAIAGTWAANLLDGQFDFFVDEAPDKVMGRHMDKPVFKLADAPAGSTVFLALPTGFVENIHERISVKYPELNFVMPVRH